MQNKSAPPLFRRTNSHFQARINMAGFSNVGETDALKAIFNSGLTAYVALYSADPGEAGAANTSEIAYTGYARAATVLSAANWPVITNGTGLGEVSNAVAVVLGQNTGAQVNATHFALVKTASGAGDIIISDVLRDTNGAVAAAVIANGAIPQFAIGQLKTTLD
jgi:hypothetical protein